MAVYAAEILTSVRIKANIPILPMQSDTTTSGWRIESRPRLLAGVLIGLLVLAIVPRLGYLLFKGELWADEVNLALNIGPRPFWEMGRPFLHLQVAPWGAMVLIKIATMLFGLSNVAYRLVPFLAAMGAVYLTYPIARRSHGAMAGIMAMIVTGNSYGLAYYAAELKPYSLDAGVGALLTFLCVRTLDEPESKKPWIILTVAGIVCAWISLPSLFVLGACGVALFIDAIVNGRGIKHIARIVAGGVAWLASFGIHYQSFIARSALATNTNVAKYWSDGFAPFPPTSLAELRWYPGKFFFFFNSPGGLPLRYVAGLFFLFGIYTLVKRGKYLHGILFFTPALLAICAAAMGKYPSVGRLMLFAVPSMFVVIGIGLGELLESSKGWKRGLGVVLALLIVVPGLSKAYAKVTDPVAPTELPHLMATMAEQRRDDDKLFMVGAGLATLYLYHNERLGLPGTYDGAGGIRDFDENKNFPALRDVASKTFGHGRVWLIMDTQGSKSDKMRAHRSVEPFDIFLRRFFDRHGGKGQFIAEAEGLSLYLYDFSEAVLPPGIEGIRNPL